MSDRKTRGYCKYCGKMFAKSGIVRHIKSCKDRKAVLEEGTGEEKSKYFTLMIADRYSTDYWMVVDVIATATFQELDRFLRDIWLECCGHLSRFDFGNFTMESNLIYYDEDCYDLHHQLGEVFDEGVWCIYTYDFGSSTQLIIEAKAVREGKSRSEKIVIESRNEFIRPNCSFCGGDAAWVISDGFYNGKPYMCEACYNKAMEDEDSDVAKEIEEMDYYDLEFASHVCNSPRMGVCGYEGSMRYPDIFIPDKKA